MSSTKACAATLKAVAQDYRDNLKTLNADFKKDTANAKADLKECEIALKDFDRSAAKATGDKKPKAKVLKLKRKPTGKRQAKKSAPLKKAASTRKRP